LKVLKNKIKIKAFRKTGIELKINLWSLARNNNQRWKNRSPNKAKVVEELANVLL